MIIQPGPVVDFLIANQNVRDPSSLDWAKVFDFSVHFSSFIILYGYKKPCNMCSVLNSVSLRNKAQARALSGIVT